MNRRTFLKGMIALAVAPAIVRADSLMKIVPLGEILRAGDFVIDLATKNIRYVGAGNTTYSVLELHRILQSRFDEPDAMIYSCLSLRHTDQFIEFGSSYNIDNTVAEKLHSGSVVQRNGIFRGCTTIGY